MALKLISALIFGIITQSTGWRPFVVNFLNESYELYHPEIVNFNVTIKNQTFLDVHITIARELPQVLVDFLVLHDSGDGAYDNVFMNRTVDVCTFLRNRKSNAFFDIVYRMFAEHGELPQRCPLRRKRYEFLNVFVNPDTFPPFMPDHKAKVSAMTWYKYKGAKTILAKFRLNVILQRSFKKSGN